MNLSLRLLTLSSTRSGHETKASGINKDHTFDIRPPKVRAPILNFCSSIFIIIDVLSPFLHNFNKLKHSGGGGVGEKETVWSGAEEEFRTGGGHDKSS